MPSITLKNVFPPNTLVGAYPANSRHDGSPPVAVALLTAVADDNYLVTFDLPAGPYVAYAPINGTHQYVGFIVDSGSTPDGTGPAGPQGPIGPAGPVGPAGPQGPAGPAGTDGIQGPAGTGISLKGSVAAVGNLPGAGNAIGDAYIVLASGHLYVYDGSAFVDAGPFVGPQGPTGPQGPQGAQGPTGPAGAQGPTGATGLQGATGNTGLTGPAGATGAQGATGAAGSNGAAGSQITFATTTPSSGTGANGDININPTTWDVHRKVSGAWALQGNIKGATGTTGATGPAGSPLMTQLVQGNLGATKTVDLAGLTNASIGGTLNANCALTLSNGVDGFTGVLCFVQDATGSRTLTVNGQLLDITTTANSAVTIPFWIHNSNFFA